MCEERLPGALQIIVPDSSEEEEQQQQEQQEEGQSSSDGWETTEATDEDWLVAQRDSARSA